MLIILKVNSHATSGKGPWKWLQAKEAMMDPKTYVFFIIGLCNTIPAGALSGVRGNIRIQFSSQPTNSPRSSFRVSLSRTWDSARLIHN